MCNHLAPPLQIPVISFPLLMLLLEQVPEDECEALGSSESLSVKGVETLLQYNKISVNLKIATILGVARR